MPCGILDTLLLQKLKAENDELKRILSGSVVFLEREDKEKVSPSLQCVHFQKQQHS